MRFVKFALILGVLMLASHAPADVVLVKSGKPNATIVLPAKPSEAESLGAQKLQFYVEKMSGATLPTASKQPEKGNIVVIGREGVNATLVQDMRAKNVPEESCYVATHANMVRISADDERGILNGVYFFLEQLGCRWYFPGEWGTVIPKSNDVVAKVSKKIYQPSFKIRAGLPGVGTATDSDSAWALNEWGRGNHLGGYSWWGAGHSYDYMISPGEYFASHPEWFALINGKRNTAQLCTTNPEMREQAVKNLLATLKNYGNNVPKLICISPNDNNSFCQCENCQKLIPTLPNGEKDWNNSIDRIVDFANFIDEAIQKVYPGHYVTYYCNYHSVGTPQIVTPSKNTVFWLTHWADDQFHGVNDNSKLGKAITDWSKYGNPLFLYTYWGAYGSYAFWPAVHAIANDAVYFHKKGAMGVYSETHQNWGGQHLNFIVFPRLLWDVNLDVDAYIDEFCTKFYGPAAAPMREYYRKLEDVAIKGPAQYQVMQQLIPIFSPAVLTELRGRIDDANAKVASADPVYKTRMDFVTKGFVLGEAYFGAQNLIREYSRTRDESLKTKAIALIQESKDILADPKYHFKLTNPEFPAEPIIDDFLNKLTKGTTFPVGDFSYHDTVERGGLTYATTVKKSGFIEGYWGMNLPGNAVGELVYDMKAEEGAFTKCLITQLISTGGVSTQIEVADSIDGPWTTAATNDDGQGGSLQPIPVPIDITKAIQGKSSFFLKIHMKNMGSGELCPLIRFTFTGSISK